MNKSFSFSILQASAHQKNLDIGANIFIGNLDPEVDEKLLYDTFSAFGVILQTPKVMWQTPFACWQWAVACGVGRLLVVFSFIVINLPSGTVLINSGQDLSILVMELGLWEPDYEYNHNDQFSPIFFFHVYGALCPQKHYGLLGTREEWDREWVN